MLVKVAKNLFRNLIKYNTDFTDYHKQSVRICEICVLKDKEMSVKLKICGMKFSENILETAQLQPDFMGFIFYEKSPRFYLEEAIPEINVQKVGVFVNASEGEIIEKIKKYDLNLVQLHGNESSDFCKNLKENFLVNKLEVEIIKAFSVDENFDFGALITYEENTDYFLFDTKGKLYGGNGTVFNWQILKNYTLKKPYFLSGGIGIFEINQLKTFLKTPESKYCFAIDVNSKFEIEPGLKDKTALGKFKKALYENEI